MREDTSMELPEEKKEEGRSAPGKLVIYFVSVGQGDSTVILTPTGQIFVIDLGTVELQAGHDPLAFFSSDDIFGKYKTLDGLILTHSDKDHYNSVGVLYNLSVTIGSVYHSNLIRAYSIKSDTISPVKGRNPPSSMLLQMCNSDDSKIKELSLNDQDRSLRWRVGNTFKTENIKEGNNVGEYVKDKGFCIHNDSGCGIYLLCGNVEAEGAEVRANKRQKTNSANYYETAIVGAKLVNMASIITLAEFNGKQCLICGDAVGETEEFILNTYPKLQDIHILRIPHHGSDSEDSSSTRFVTKMNPRNIIISVPKKSTSYSHPRCGIIQRYVDKCPRLVKKEDNITAADSSTYGCYYTSYGAPADVSHTKFPWETTSYYNPSKTSNANIYITGRDGHKHFEVT
jgi:beta-lactamase superfamily II metal-dependent hydrolase